MLAEFASVAVVVIGALFFGFKEAFTPSVVTTAGTAVGVV
jgi:hypothetical protein